MNYEELKKLHEEFAKNSKKMNDEFTSMFKKWLKKDPRLTMLGMFTMPINLMCGALSTFEKASELFPEFPDVLIRQFKPFEKLKDKWGKIPSKKFFEEYAELYNSQFDKFFASEQDKKEFTDWYAKSMKEIEE